MRKRFPRIRIASRGKERILEMSALMYLLSCYNSPDSNFGKHTELRTEVVNRSYSSWKLQLFSVSRARAEWHWDNSKVVPIWGQAISWGLIHPFMLSFSTSPFRLVRYDSSKVTRRLRLWSRRAGKNVLIINPKQKSFSENEGTFIAGNFNYFTRYSLRIKSLSLLISDVNKFNI